MLLNKDSAKLEDLAAELADSSVSLIVTDPPYTVEKAEAAYAALARLAQAKLKPGGSCVFYYGSYHLPLIIHTFEEQAPELIKSHLIRAHPRKGGIAKLREMGFGI